MIDNHDIYVTDWFTGSVDIVATLVCDITTHKECGVIMVVHRLKFIHLLTLVLFIGQCSAMFFVLKYYMNYDSMHPTHTNKIALSHGFT